MALGVVLGGAMTREQTTYSYACHDLSSSSAMTHSYVCDMTHPRVCHDSFIRVSWLIYRVMTYLGGATTRVLICVTRLIHMYATWLIHMCAMTHSYVCRDLPIVSWLILVVLWPECRHDSSIHVCRLIHTRVMTYLHVCYDSMTYLYVCMCAMTLCFMTRDDWSLCVLWLCMCALTLWLIYMTNLYVCYDSVW